MIILYECIVSSLFSMFLCSKKAINNCTDVRDNLMLKCYLSDFVAEEYDGCNSKRSKEKSLLYINIEHNSG